MAKRDHDLRLALEVGDSERVVAVHLSQHLWITVRRANLSPEPSPQPPALTGVLALTQEPRELHLDSHWRAIEHR